MPHVGSASIAPITAFQMPSADDLGFYTKKRLNLYDANIEDIGSHASRLSIAAHTDTNLVDAEVLAGSSGLGELDTAKRTSSMNSLRLTSALSAPGAILNEDNYQNPVISNLKDPVEFLHNKASNSALNPTDLEYLRRPIVPTEMVETGQLTIQNGGASIEELQVLDNCAASVLTVKKLIAVAMEGDEALKRPAISGGAPYYSESVRDLINANARQALNFKGSFEAMDLKGIRDDINEGVAVNGDVYVVTKHHPDVLRGLHIAGLNTASEVTGGADIHARLGSTGYGGVGGLTQLSPFFVQMKSADANQRVTDSVYISNMANPVIETKLEILSTDAALSPSELVGVAATQTVIGDDDASYVLGNEYNNFSLHRGDLVLVQHSDAGGGQGGAGDLKFSFIQRNIPDEQIASQDFVYERIEASEDYLKRSIKDTGTNMLYLTGLMQVPSKEGTGRDQLSGYQMDEDEESIKVLLQGTHSDVRDRYGQQITKARFLYSLTDFGDGELSGPHAVTNSSDINANPDNEGHKLWQALVSRTTTKMNSNLSPELTELIQPHEDMHYHNLALTCAYLQHQVNILGRQLYLLVDNDEGFVDTVSGRQDVLSNYQTGGGNVDGEPVNDGEGAGDFVEGSVGEDGALFVDGGDVVEEGP